MGWGNERWERGKPRSDPIYRVPTHLLRVVEEQRGSAMLFMYESGKPTAPAIVFLHGAGLSGRKGQPQMELLPDYYCLAPDLPEQGKSLHTGSFRLEDTARQVVTLIDEKVPGKRAHLVGLSLGADLALAITQIARYQMRCSL